MNDGNGPYGHPIGFDEDGGFPGSVPKKDRPLPDDLPKSLDDRRTVPEYAGETEMYDGWQGTPLSQSHDISLDGDRGCITDVQSVGKTEFSPITAKPLSFNLALDDHTHDEEYEMRARYGRSFYDEPDDATARIEDSDARLMEMLAAQAAHREMNYSLGADEEDIIADDKLSEDEKRNILQRNLNMAASNGDVDRVRKLVSGKAQKYVDVNKPDEEGTVPLIYASCFVSVYRALRQRESAADY